MPRIPRSSTDGQVLHVLSRGNDRRTVFHHAGDYSAFLDLMKEALGRFDVDVYAFCVMPNHFHMVVRPESVSDLSGFMQWLLTSHVRRYHKFYKTSGHLWQGRFKSFLVQQDEHLLTVLRYVLQNPVRAALAASPFDWRWNSLHSPHLTEPWPLDPPGQLQSWLMDGIPEFEMAAIRRSVIRKRPFGSPEWLKQQVEQNPALASTLRPRGRPAGAADPRKGALLALLANSGNSGELK